jgi:murein DD-endopeptidase MepM/ murein hydrolase activator NlpD
LLILIALMPSCQRRQTPAVTVSPTPIETEVIPPVNELPSSPGVTASSVIAKNGSEPFEVGVQAPTPAPDPLKISFPQAQPVPISAWRPPLYPTPWALSPHDHFYFTRPIAADEVNWPLWDYRYGGSVFEDVIHTGIDITAPMYTPVIAAGSGEVVWAGKGLYYGTYKEDDPYGNAVEIHHDFGYNGKELYTVYGHMDRIDVVRGQHVDVGQALGVSGQTGKVTGPHLHFEVRLGDKDFFDTFNPELWLVPPEGWGLLAGRVLNTGGLMNTLQNVIITNLDTRQEWLVKSYGGEAVNSDPYYQENLVIGDLPAGHYEIKIAYTGRYFTQELDIYPGAISYFTFQGRKGFTMEGPPQVEFTP